MDDLTLWVTVVLAALISLLAIFFAISPLLQPGRASTLLEDDKLVELLGRKDSALQAIKDLEFDYRVGKISQEDYQRLDQRLRRQAIGLMQQIEKLAPTSASLDEELESIIAQFRQTVMTPTTVTSTTVTPASNRALSGETRASSAAAPTPVIDTTHAGRFCTECGKPVAVEHKFCAYCGTPIAQIDPAQEG